MKKIICMFALIASCSNLAYSENIVDIYGADKTHSITILKKYTKQVAEIQSELVGAWHSEILSGNKNTVKIKKIQSKKTALQEKIKKDGEFLFVSLQTITYPSRKNSYTTIEVIEKNQSERLRFVNSNVSIKKSQRQSNLIDKMIEYDKLTWKLMLEHQLPSKDYICPVYHCMYAFDTPILKPYLTIFNSGVIKDKQLILDTLNHDPDPERRAEVAFLVGHFKDPHEIIELLSQHVNDKSELVRNNAMRVIGATIEKAKIMRLDISPFLALLNSPYETDRNKALYILFHASGTPSSRRLILQQGKGSLLALLRLKQPNNHDYAYLILKKISGKTYGEYDIEAWDKWLTFAQNSLKKAAG